MMAGTFRIAEYVPRSAVRLGRLCRFLFVCGAAAVLVLFGRQLQEAEERRAQCSQWEDAAESCAALTALGDSALEAGDGRLAERLYLTALQQKGTDAELYLKLSKLYREYRRYDLAQEILEEYPGEDGAVSEAERALREEVERLEISIFQSR